MTNYHATLDRFQPFMVNSLAASQTWVSNLLKSSSRWLIEWHTRKVLEGLDRSTLEDIGVPHEDQSLRAGELKRYPSIIRRGMWSRD